MRRFPTLTRESVRIRLDDDVDWDERFAMTDEEVAAEDAEFERECLTFERERAERLRSMTTLQRYRYERREALISILRTRDRIARWTDVFKIDFLLDEQRAHVKRRQSDLLGWRTFLRTGIEPRSDR